MITRHRVHWWDVERLEKMARLVREILLIAILLLKHL
jgi:hypothetical protein